MGMPVERMSYVVMNMTTKQPVKVFLDHNEAEDFSFKMNLNTEDNHGHQFLTVNCWLQYPANEIFETW